MAGDDAFDRIATWARAHTVELIEEATGVSLDASGRMPCPLHGGRGPNFAVSKDGFFCHSRCKENGDVIRFLMLYRGFADRTAVLRDLAPRAHVAWHAARATDDGVHPFGYRINAPTPARRLVAATADRTDPYKPTKNPPDTSKMNGGEPLDRYPVKNPHALAVYPYSRPDGTVVALAVRVPDPERGKALRWHHPDGRMSSRKQGNPLPGDYKGLVYRLPELRTAIDAGCDLVCIAEGEKDVDTLRDSSLGFVATCNPGGEGKWSDAHTEHLRGCKRIAIFADNDRVGREHAEQVRASIARVLPLVEVRVIALEDEWKDFGVKDVTDLVAACDHSGVDRERTRKALDKRISDAFAAVPAANLANAPGEVAATDENGGDGTTPASTGAPRLVSADLYGPLGDWVRVWEPHTEATPVALYATALAALGAMIGRGAYLRVNADQHAPRLFVLLVGPSGRGRKGVTVNIMRSLVREVDADFARACEATGLSTTEGFINRLRDEVPARLGPNGKEIPPVAGVTDKRLLVVEEEAGGLLKVMRREGNDLSATLRTAWDGRTVQRITKGDPITATDPHLVFIGAITPNELREQLRAGDVFNGFANRLLPIYADAGTLLPFAESPDPYTLAAAIDPIREAVRWARAQRGQLHLSHDARVWWAAQYPQLVRPNVRSETLRVLQERGAPYVLRMALLLALLDRSRLVQVAHLTAACALWQYAAGTWGRVFPDGTRGGIAGRFEEALRKAGPDGLSRTELRNVLPTHNVDNADVTAALRELMDDGLIERIPSRPTRGRPPEQWRHVWCAVPTMNDTAPDKNPRNLGNMGMMGTKSDEPPTFFGQPGDTSHHSHSSHLSPDLVDGREGEVGGTGDTSHPSHHSRVPTLYEPNDSLAAVLDDGEPTGTE